MTKSNPPKLSIITINYNNAIGLKKTVESVVNQSYEDIEYIVIDGGSTDGSADYIESIKDKLSYAISEPDDGIYQAMNKGIDQATREYLLFLNSGDWLYAKNVIEKVMRNNLSESIIYGDVHNEASDSIEIFESDLSAFYLFNKWLGHPSMLIRKELFTSIGYYRTDFDIISDWVFYTNAILKHNCSYKHLDITISGVEAGGISQVSSSKHLLEEERKQYLILEFPLYLNDLSEFNQIKRLTSSRLVKFAIKLIEYKSKLVKIIKARD